MTISPLQASLLVSLMMNVIINIYYNDNHHHCQGMAEGELKNREPQKCEEWKWFGWDEIPRPLFLSFENLLKKKFTPFAS